MDNIDNIVYRQAKETDIDNIIKLLTEYISKHRYYTSVKRLKDMLNNTFVALVNNTIIGAVAIGELGDTILGENSEDIEYEIAYIALDKQSRNKGIATELLRLSIESMPANTVIACEAVGFINSDRANAASALKNNGFKLVKTFKSYYKNTEQLEDGCDLCAMKGLTECEKCSAYLYIRE